MYKINDHQNTLENRARQTDKILQVLHIRKMGCHWMSWISSLSWYLMWQSLYSIKQRYVTSAATFLFSSPKSQITTIKILYLLQLLSKESSKQLTHPNPTVKSQVGGTASNKSLQKRYLIEKKLVTKSGTNSTLSDTRFITVI